MGPDSDGSRQDLRRRAVAFSRLLVGLLVAYALIIATSGRLLGSVARVIALAIVLLAALRIRHVSRGRTDAIGVVAVLAVLVTAATSVFAGGELLAVLTAITTIILVCVTSALVIHSLAHHARRDVAAVLGVPVHLPADRVGLLVRARVGLCVRRRVLRGIPPPADGRRLPGTQGRGHLAGGA
jgi:hypothetical protein